jgi:hypothetical protein
MATALRDLIQVWAERKKPEKKKITRESLES